MTQQRGSFSSLSTHRSCPQKFNYSDIQKLEKVDPDDAKAELNLGNWWHALRAAESIERGRRLGSLQYTPKELRVADGWPRIPTDSDTLWEDVWASAQGWWDSLTPYIQEIWPERVGEGLLERMEYLDARWQERWREERENEHPLGVEIGWGRPLPSLPQYDGTRTDPETTMVGYVDEVYYDTQRKLVVARDHKTTKALGTQSTADDMMDSQLQIYAWGANPKVSEWGYGPVKAVAFDRVRTMKPKTPKLNKSGTLSKSIKDFDVYTYIRWALGDDGEGLPYEGLRKDGSGAGMYLPEDEVIEGMSDPAALSVWHQRTLTPLNRNVVTVHLRASVDTAFDMAKTKKRVEVDGEAGRNLSSACRWCDFNLLCRAQMVGGAEGEYDLESMKLRKRGE